MQNAARCQTLPERVQKKNRKTREPISVEPGITEISAMISEESRRKLRELGMDKLVEVLDEQEAHGAYAALAFLERLDITVDSFYTRKNASRAKRLLRSAKFRYPDADVSTLYYEGRELNRNLIL